MKIKDILSVLETLSPLTYAEGFDNTGLLIGDQNAKVSGILVTLDTLETVVDEAIEKGCNLIVSFHPIIFSGLKQLTGKTYVERVVQKAIKNDIAIYSNHTALDNAWNGVNAKICEKLGLEDRKILIPQKNTIRKLTTFVPTASADAVRKAIFETGAGGIGNYDNCSFNIEGLGSFRPLEGADPVIGNIGTTHFEKETQLNIIFPKHLESKALKALFEAHPYEEVAYEVITLNNDNQQIGMGMIGTFENALTNEEFLKLLRETMKADGIRHSEICTNKIKKVAVLGGSGSFAINAAKRAGADAFVSADFKYHDFFSAENEILLVDIGHYESEQYTKELLHTYLIEATASMASEAWQKNIRISETNTNPVRYF